MELDLRAGEWQRGAVPRGTDREMERDASQSVIPNVIHRPDAQINATQKQGGKGEDRGHEINDQKETQKKTVETEEVDKCLITADP